MSVAIVTGSSGLIGSETVKFLHEKGMEVVGIDNNMRKYFFGEDGSTEWKTRELSGSLKNFTHNNIDIRDQDPVFKLFEKYGKNIKLVAHTAAQPSHDWAAKEPFTDFGVNANGTLVMLEAARRHCPDAVFEFTSTNKVYGDTPNFLPLVEHESRWEPEQNHKYAEHGIDESMSIDNSKHSIFGASKVAADVMTQEYGRYFGMKTAVFRGGCLTGPSHSGAELHGFLAYLVKCAVTGRKYSIFGYKGKQVRDNIHSYDMVNAMWHFFEHPRVAEVYNMGGSRHSNCSVLEAIKMIEEMTGRRMNYEITGTARIGDHIWYVSDVRKFKSHYSGWKYEYDLKRILRDIVDATRERSS
ncbi:MAG: NAD-dependent epimerase [Bdellovibrionales bacterium RIFOXYD1_FULL_53_11]|nr:MAG: NAD-dependent epimerase [Bdellovibrionales bacterium RIFOXYD1_FULL_53_11]